MTDEQIAEHMGWSAEMASHNNDLSARVRTLVAAAEAAMRADRDSLRDALAALVRVVAASDIYLSVPDEWQALESARHVLGEKRA